MINLILLFIGVFTSLLLCNAIAWVIVGLSVNFFDHVIRSSSQQKEFSALQLRGTLIIACVVNYLFTMYLVHVICAFMSDKIESHLKLKVTLHNHGGFSLAGLTDVDLWANSENLNSVLENCLRFVIIDKTLLACLLVIELIDLRQACEIIEGRRHFPTDPNQSIAQEDALNPNKSYNEKSGVKGDIEISTSTGNRKGAFAGQETEKKPKESISPRREKLRNLKHSKTELEKEISEVHEDTSKLETELFSTMEEKTKVEEELFGMKHHVTKLRSELFHLKLEKSNLENDVKRSQSQENLQQSIDGDDGKVVVESPKEVVRTYPELSDVMEVSHESKIPIACASKRRFWASRLLRDQGCLKANWQD